MSISKHRSLTEWERARESSLWEGEDLKDKGEEEEECRGHRRSCQLCVFVYVRVARSGSVTMQLFKNTAHNIYIVTFFSTQTFEVRRGGIRAKDRAQ